MASNHQNQTYPNTLWVTQVPLPSPSNQGPVPCNKPGFPTPNLLNNKNQQKGEEKNAPRNAMISTNSGEAAGLLLNMYPLEHYIPLKLLVGSDDSFPLQKKMFPRFMGSFSHFPSTTPSRWPSICVPKWCPIQTHQTNHFPPIKMVILLTSSLGG